MFGNTKAPEPVAGNSQQVAVGAATSPQPGAFTGRRVGCLPRNPQPEPAREPRMSQKSADTGAARRSIGWGRVHPYPAASSPPAQAHQGGHRQRVPPMRYDFNWHSAYRDISAGYARHQLAGNTSALLAFSAAKDAIDAKVTQECRLHCPTLSESEAGNSEAAYRNLVRLRDSLERNEEQLPRKQALNRALASICKFTHQKSCQLASPADERAALPVATAPYHLAIPVVFPNWNTMYQALSDQYRQCLARSDARAASAHQAALQAIDVKVMASYRFYFNSRWEPVAIDVETAYDALRWLRNDRTPDQSTAGRRLALARALNDIDWVTYQKLAELAPPGANASAINLAPRHAHPASLLPSAAPTVPAASTVACSSEVPGASL